MSAKKNLIAAGLIVAILCAVAVVAILENPEPAQEIARPKAEPKIVVAPPSEAAIPMETARVEKPAAPPEAARQTPADANHTNAASPPAVTANAAQASGVGDPLARDALSYVGADPDAEKYWISAINNPDLSADERQNLIEDLNEDGLSDPQNPSAEDLPLIVNRLQLIEELAPDAMDDVNAAAFQEAYKDLVNLYTKLARN